MSRVTVNGIAAVVVDIEGTTSATSFVYERLFPYARERFPEWIMHRTSDPQVASIIAQVAQASGVTSPSDAQVLNALNGWLDRDEKVTPLKDLQGLIWAEGFERGELESHLFPDVLPALRRWQAAGLREYVYSSGSVTAQRSWFSHTPEGDVRNLFDGYFDTANAGPKRERRSYEVIQDAVGFEPTQLLFLSDVEAELDAARDAGWRTIGLCRPGEPHSATGTPGHPQVESFDQIVFDSLDLQP